MWMEAKSVLTGISIIMIVIVLAIIITANILLGFLLIIALGMILFGDILICMKIVDFKPLFEPTPQGWELMELQLIDGKTIFMNTKKGAYGKRSFRIHNEDASVFNDGGTNFNLGNGNRGFRAHENFDHNIDPRRAKALEQMKGENVKDMYKQATKVVDNIDK